MARGREKYVEAFAVLTCVLADIQPVDESDGSPNWWMFSERFKPLVDKLIEDGILKETPDGSDQPG